MHQFTLPTKLLPYINNPSPTTTKAKNVDDVKGVYDRLVDMWAILLGLVGGAVTVWKLSRHYGVRWIRALRLSDSLHSHYGPDPAREIIASLDKQRREGVVREARQKLVEEELDLAVYVTSPTGNCEWVNDECADLLGISPTNCIVFGWLEGIESTERERVFDSWMHAVKNKLPYECRYTVHNRRTGQKFPCVTKAYPLMSSDGKVWCYTGTVSMEKSNG